MFRGVAVWLAIMALETLHGVLREVFLVPRVGTEMAGRFGWPLGLAIVVATALVTIRWIGLRGRAAHLRLGLVWATLTLFFETCIGLLRGLDVADIVAAFNPTTGGLMFYGLVVMALAPAIADRLRH